MENDWAFDLENKIFSIVKTKANKTVVARDKDGNDITLLQKFPKLKFTMTNRNETIATFPTVYIHELAGQETGNTLDGNNINAVMENIEITVYTDSTQDDAKKIMSVVIGILKELKFSVNQMPEFTNLSTTYRCIARARRLYGSGDIL